MRLIAITQSVKVCENRNERLDVIDHNLIKFVKTCGYLSVPIPNNLSSGTMDYRSKNNDLINWLKIILPSGIILSGGANLGCYPDRDLTENMLLNYAEINKIPVLGICRGMQMMAHWKQCGLKKVSGHVNDYHLVKGKINRVVNSFHDFSIKSCPENFKILAKGLNGEIEAIKHNYLPMEGWMWHPEREKCFDHQDVKRFKKLFKQCICLPKEKRILKKRHERMMGLEV